MIGRGAGGRIGIVSGREVPSNPVACPAKHANRQQPPTLMSRSPARKAPALSLSKTQNVAKLTSQISSSRRMFSWLSRALRVIVSNDGVGVAMDAPLASDNDNPAALRTGRALLRRFRLEVRDTDILPNRRPASPSNRCRISQRPTCIRRSAIPSFLPKPRCAPTTPKQYDCPAPAPTAWLDDICKSSFRLSPPPLARTRDK